VKRCEERGTRLRFQCRKRTTDPREPDLTKSVGEFVTATAKSWPGTAWGRPRRLQIFDLRTLARAQVEYPLIRKVVLFAISANASSGSVVLRRVRTYSYSHQSAPATSLSLSRKASRTRTTPLARGPVWPSAPPRLTGRPSAHQRRLRGHGISPEEPSSTRAARKAARMGREHDRGSEFDAVSRPVTGKHFTYQFRQRQSNR